MVKRKSIGSSPAERLVELLKEARTGAGSGHTVPAGIKVLEGGENVYWGGYDPFGDSKDYSLRDLAGNLDEAEIRIEEARTSLQETQGRLDDAEVVVQDVQSSLDTIEKVTIPDAVAELVAVDEAAQEQFTQLDSRLDSFATDDAMSGIRQALTEAQALADSASATATSANQAANAASQAALEAAGIAASKGRVIVSETEPTGEDRNPSNIWIKPVPDDPDTEVEEKAVTYVYLTTTDEWQPTTSSELAQAAQNALDAREAAQQAQQRADTAISNAATAQSAAEAAQRTASQATLDAADAHNAAVEAQEGVDAAIARGDSLLLNGGFEQGDIGWPPGGAHGDRSRIVEDPAAARTGSFFLELTPSWANAYPESDLIQVEPGQVLHARMWGKRLAGDNASRLSILHRRYDASKTHITLGYVSDLFYADDLPDGEWVLIEGDYTVPEGTHYLALAAHTVGSSTDVFHVDDFQVVDVTEARAALARAEEAYDEAASKLDEDQVDAKIVASANGKNSITISANEPSGNGVRPGDTWWRSDGAGDIFGQWVWNGSVWTRRQIRSEVIANLDVSKLTVSGSASMAEAVIGKLWADGIAAKTATLQRLTVADGDLAPSEIRWASGQGNGPGEPWRTFSLDTTDPSVRVPGGDNFSRVVYHPMEIKKGVRYRFSMDMKASVAGIATFAQLLKGDALGNVTSGHFGLSSTTGSANSAYLAAQVIGGAADTWTTITSEFVPNESGYALFRVWPNHSAGTANPGGYHWFRNFSLRPMTGAVQIENGAITTPKLTVTEDMSAKIVNSMSVATKKLVVSEEAILNHATLIGQTVVDDINVQGKLIGTDGVFTGTVDFENVNVTGDLLAANLQGESITGVSVTGSTIRTNIVDGTYAELSHNARWGRPGLSFRMPGFSEPASITSRTPVTDPNLGDVQGRIVISSGYDVPGSTSHVVAAKQTAFLESGGSFVSVDPGGARMRSKGTASIGDGAMSFIESRDHEAIFAYRTSVSGDDGYIRHRALVADANSVKLKAWANLNTDGEPVWYREYDMFNLVEPPWKDVALRDPYTSGGTGSRFQFYKIGTRVHLRGRVFKKSGQFLQNGSEDVVIGFAGAFTPRIVERRLIATGNSSGVARVEIKTNGDIGVYPITGDADWVDFAGIWYDTAIQ